jgi:sugar/nucleoside kinase (ribokinase family)
MRISGVGCCVLDVLHDVPPGEGEARMARYLSRADGDGGLVRGGAVLRRALEERFGRPASEIVVEIAGGAAPTTTLGGVATAGLIAAAQLLRGEGIDVRLYANLSDDEDGALVRRLLARTPLSTDRIGTRRGRFPTTQILNERGDGGTGERTFIAEAGVSEALALAPEDLDRAFLESEVTLFSAMWWEPRLFAHLTRLLEGCKRAGSVTVVGTAFDPSRGLDRSRWALGDSDEAYRYVDVLVANRAEALLYAGETEVGRAAEFFRRAGVGACVVTEGVEPVYYWSGGRPFAPAEGRLPVPAAILRDKASGALPTGDSVGCGDNFAGGVVASIALQRKGGQALSLREAVLLGNLCGGIASTHAGGVFNEQYPGEKRDLVSRYRSLYERQLAETRG